MYLVVWQSIWTSESAFRSAAAQLQSLVADRALVAETSIEGFSAFVMSQAD